MSMAATTAGGQFAPLLLEWRRPAKAAARGRTGRRALLRGRRKERVHLDLKKTMDEFPISQFIREPAGVESLLNTRALQSFHLLDSRPLRSSDDGGSSSSSHTYRCRLHKVQLLNFEVTPVLDLRILPTHRHCTVELLSCRFVGSKAVEQQNDHFSASMKNFITWGSDERGYCLHFDVSLEVTLEVYTQPFSLLPLDAVQVPGNLFVQGLLDRLVPLLTEQLISDYFAWIETRREGSSFGSGIPAAAATPSDPAAA